MSGLQLKIGAVSEIGLCKRENQDRVLARVGEGPLGDFGLFVIADGMGGQAGGREAAETAIQVCEDWWRQIMPQYLAAEAGVVEMAVASLVQAVQHLNERILLLGRRLQSAPGTTLSVLFLYGNSYGYIHVGDSRIYQSAGELVQLTPDDTWVARQVSIGALTAAEALIHPKKHILTQCAGVGKHLHVHRGTGPTDGIRGFILCSDGFYQHLCPQELDRLTAFPAHTAGLLEEAVAIIHSRGAADNLSAIVITL